MDELSSSYTDYDYSGDYTDYTDYSTSTTINDELSPMWEQISRMPFVQLEQTKDYAYIEKVASLVAGYQFSGIDKRMSEPRYTMCIARLLKLLSSKCSSRVEELSQALRSSEDTFNAKVDLQVKEIERLRNDLEEALCITGAEDADVKRQRLRESGEIKALKLENDNLALELRRVSRMNDELNQTLKAREEDRKTLATNYEKMQLEYKHLVSRYSKLLEKSNKSENSLADVKDKEKSRRVAMDNKVEKLEKRVAELQKESANLVKSRDRAEDICERRETEALRDMNQLKHLTEQIIKEEREKLAQRNKEFAFYKEEMDAHIEKILSQHEEEMHLKEEELALLNRQLEKTGDARQKRRFDDDDSCFSESNTTDPTDTLLEEKVPAMTADVAHQRLVSEQRRLERENDDLLAQVEQLEMNLEAIEEENKKLNRLVTNYERGDDGLRKLRHELDDANRSVERLQAESAQLRERLNSMDDSLTFTAALQELCRRIGVTEDEINSLRPQNAAAFSEMDTLKEELNILKEEVEWLEKERRHWMNKVRLQPLMDTKLRFELGLTSEQLRQLDNLVDQMREGRVVVEDDEAPDYKKKYFMELDARRRDASQFNEYVKQKIDTALQQAFGGVETQDAVTAISRLKDHMDAIITGAGQVDGSGAPTESAGAPLFFQQQTQEPYGADAGLLRERVESLQRRLHESELTMRDSAATVASLRERLAAVVAERDLVSKERDQYRDAIFDAAGLAAEEADRAEEASFSAMPDPADADKMPAAGSSASTAGIRLSNAKWATVSTTLREQLHAKDTIIASFGEQVHQLQAKMAAQAEAAQRTREETKAEAEQHQLLRDQLAAATELNEDLAERNRELEKTAKDLQEGLQLRDDAGEDSRSMVKDAPSSSSGGSRALLQKIVLLRRREATLLQRLRRSVTAQEEATASERAVRETLGRTLASLQAAMGEQTISGGAASSPSYSSLGTGFVLPPSSSRHNTEEQMLDHLHRSVDDLLNGRLFREDARFLAHLQQVYRVLEHVEELTELRLSHRAQIRKTEELQKTVDEQAVELESLRVSLANASIIAQAPSTSGQRTASKQEGEAATAAAVAVEDKLAMAGKWEAEAAAWRHKYALATKRLDAKVDEVSVLEKDLDAMREELIDTREHVGSILRGYEEKRKGGVQAEGSPPGGFPAAVEGTDAREGQGGKPATQEQPAPPLRESNNNGALDAIARAEYLEREVARLKSINLALLTSSLDAQGQIRSLEIEVESKTQEVTLIRSSGDAHVVSDFVSAAIREHAALRKQSELAMITAKRLRVQLAATEANYYIAANEATSYRMSAHRLYRRYVDETVRVVDFLRGVQRHVRGAMSPHRVEVMDRRLRGVAQELQTSLARGKSLSMRLADQTAAVVTLEQQLALMKMNTSDSKDGLADAVEAKLREARAQTREHARQLAECREDCKHAQAKTARIEAHVQLLNEELARLEFAGVSGARAAALDENVLEKLHGLRESVLASQHETLLNTSGRALVPALNTASGFGNGADTDTAIREYKGSLLKQGELFKECASLRVKVEGQRVELAAAAAAVSEHRAELVRFEEQQHQQQRQLLEERARAEAREARLQRSHEAQRDVAARATERTVRSLQDMMKAKEEALQQLRRQLDVERRRFVEQQVAEAARMERLHENLFHENAAMVERLKEAVAGAAGDSFMACQSQLPSQDGAASYRLEDGNSTAVAEQLQALTAETVRLQSEVKHARTTNIVLESQLGQQVQLAQDLQAQITALEMHKAQHKSSFALSPGTSAVVDSSAVGSNGYTPEAGAIAAATAATANTDALTGIVRSQSALLDSLRQRELSLSQALQREQQQRTAAEEQLEAARLRLTEHGGAVDLATRIIGATGGLGKGEDMAFGESPTVAQELRVQVAQLEQEVRTLRAQLAEERRAFEGVQVDAEEWQSHLAALQAQVASQQAEVDRSRELAALNAALRGDLNAVKEQNDKLVLAASVLRQKLMDEAHRSGENSRQHQQEMALAQRMGSIQQESAESMKVLDARVRKVQRELAQRVEKEEAAHAKAEEAQRLLYSLHLQLREKEREIAEFKRARSAAAAAATSVTPRGETAGAAVGSGQAPPRVEKGTQVLLSGVVPSPTTAGAFDLSPKDLGLTVSPVAMPSARRDSNGGSGRAMLGQTTAEKGLAEGKLEKRSAPASTPTTTTTLVGSEAALLPQVAGIVSREVQKHQRDNLAQLSLLRSTVTRHEQDLAASQEQLRAERAATRALRGQLAQLKKESEEAATVRARELLIQRASSADARKATTAVSGKDTTSPSVAASETATMQLEQLRERVKELESQLEAVPAIFRPRGGRNAGELVGPDPAAPIPETAMASPTDIRTHVRTVAHLESVIDALREVVAVEAPRRAQELEHALAGANRTLHRIAVDLALVKGLQTQQVLDIYGVPAVQAERTQGDLEAKLLQQANELLDYRFAKETLTLQKERAERHLRDITSVDAVAAAANTPGDGTSGMRAQQKIQQQRNQLEALEAVVDNLKLVIEKLQRENADLHVRLGNAGGTLAAAGGSASTVRHTALLREVKNLKARERDLSTQVALLSKRLADSGSRGPIMSEQHAKLQLRLAAAQAQSEQYHSELEALRTQLEHESGGGGGVSARSQFVDYRGVRPLASSTEFAGELATAARHGASDVLGVVPPPLPEAPVVQRRLRAHHGGEEGTEADSQRRLSGLQGRTQQQHPADYHHASARHHHLRDL